MATKYILVGGYPHKAEDGGKAFAEELVRGFEKPTKLIDCLFARPEENWDLAYAQDVEFFQKHLPGKKLEIVRANPDNFVEQVKWAHAVYIRGGSTDVLLKLLKKNPGWDKYLDGKTLAGSSAGAYVIGKYYHNLDTPSVGEGLGLLSLKVIAHYKSDYNAPHIDWDEVYETLQVIPEDLPILALGEGQYEAYLMD